MTVIYLTTRPSTSQSYTTSMDATLSRGALIEQRPIRQCLRSRVRLLNGWPRPASCDPS